MPVPRFVVSLSQSDDQLVVAMTAHAFDVTHLEVATALTRATAELLSKASTRVMSVTEIEAAQHAAAEAERARLASEDGAAASDPKSPAAGEA